MLPNQKFLALIVKFLTGFYRSLQVSAMWYLWTALLVVSCTLVSAGGAGERPEPATTRAPPRTLDRQAAELAWRTWLQSPESNNQNAPPRRIITKSLFITPLVCPKGQRLDGKDCVEVNFTFFFLTVHLHL